MSHGFPREMAVAGHAFGSSFESDGSLVTLTLYQNHDELELIDVPIDDPSAADEAAFLAFMGARRISSTS